MLKVSFLSSELSCLGPYVMSANVFLSSKSLRRYGINDTVLTNALKRVPFAQPGVTGVAQVPL